MLAGVMAIEVSTAADTALAFDVIAPETAVMDVAVLLLSNNVARPPVLIPTVVGLADTQVTEEVIVAVVPLLYVPIAEYC